MITYELLGRVTVQRDGRAPDLTPQQQLLLARLACANGAPVRKRDLELAVWDRGRVPDGGLKRLVYDLRTALDALSSEASVESVEGAYRLPLAETQVDALRFTSKLDAAAGSTGPRQAGLLAEALDEWGPRASGLFGGTPLLGLDGSWAAAMRKTLRTRYRDAVIDSLQQDAENHDYGSILRRCARLAGQDSLDALGDDGFLMLWVLAAYQSGRPERAERILNQATELASRSGRTISADLRHRAEQLRGQTAAAAVQSAIPVDDRRTMSQPTINFNNSPGTVVNGQVGVVNGNVTVGASDLAPSEEPDGGHDGGGSDAWEEDLDD